MMVPYWLEWFELLLRWLHLLVGVAWIGASLHFVLVDRSLISDPEDEVVKGRFWAIHGGGVYQFTKYNLAPPEWPATLHWSKWEAYTTWLTGMGLLTLIYYLRSDAYLVGAGKWVTDPGQAIWVSLGLIASSLALYEGLIRSPLARRTGLFAALIIVLVLILCWLSAQLLSNRAAFIHVGVILGSIMVGNVFFGIIPAQKAFVEAVQAGRDPDVALTLAARHRSFFNNYLTMPVLFCMVSLHFPLLYQHSLNFLGLFLVMFAGAVARHFFNLRHLNILHWRYLWMAAGLVVLTMLLLRPPVQAENNAPNASSETVESIEPALTKAEVDGLMMTHCANCHSASPTHPGFATAPGGLYFVDQEDLLRQSVRAASAIGSGYMPLGNMTKLSRAERARLMRFLITSKSEDGV
jgi:uncharacterized membrane protein